MAAGCRTGRLCGRADAADSRWPRVTEIGEAGRGRRRRSGMRWKSRAPPRPGRRMPRPVGPAQMAEGARQGGEGLIVQRHRPGAAQMRRACRARPAAASRSSRRGRRRRAGCRRCTRAAIRPARARRAAGWSPVRPAASPSGWKKADASSSSAASPVAERYWPSASSGQKTMSPCESPGRMLRSRSKNMNHCGQSPSGILLAERRAQQIAHRSKRPSASSSLDRSLADVAGAPAAAGVLLEAARGEVVDERVVDEPGQNFAEPRGVSGQRTRSRRGDPQPGGHAEPDSPPRRAFRPLRRRRDDRSGESRSSATER